MEVTEDILKIMANVEANTVRRSYILTHNRLVMYTIDQVFRGLEDLERKRKIVRKPRKTKLGEDHYALVPTVKAG